MMPVDPHSKKTFKLDLETVELLPLVIWETDSEGGILPGAAGGCSREGRRARIPKNENLAWSTCSTPNRN